MITEESIARLVRLNALKGNKAKWWVQCCKVFKGKERGCRDLKEAILLDFSTWSILGSFLASISFSGALFEGKIVPHEDWEKSDIGLLLVNALHYDSTAIGGNVFETFVVFTLLTVLISMLDGGSIQQVITYALALSSMYYTLSSASSKSTDIVVNFASTTIFMCAFVNSLRGVICGLFKYLYFVPCPSDRIVDAIAVYIEDDMNSESSVMPLVDWKTWVMPPKYWDHMGPIIKGAYCLCLGAFVLTWIKFGIVVAAPIFLLGLQFYFHMKDMKDKLWMSVWKYMRNVEEPDRYAGVDQSRSDARMREGDGMASTTITPSSTQLRRSSISTRSHTARY